MSFFHRMAGLSRRERVRSSVIWRETKVKPLLLRIKRSQLAKLAKTIPLKLKHAHSSDWMIQGDWCNICPFILLPHNDAKCLTSLSDTL